MCKEAAEDEGYAGAFMRKTTNGTSGTAEGDGEMPGVVTACANLLLNLP